jgi:hypothetical protein
MSQNRKKNLRAGKPSPRKAPWPLYALGALAILALAVLAAAVALSGGSTEGDRQAGAPSTRNAAEASGVPRLSVDRESIDLGDVKLGTYVEAAFVLTNGGDQPLRLAQPPYIEVVEGC